MNMRQWYEALHALHRYAKYSYIDIVNMDESDVEYFLALEIESRKEEEKNMIQKR